VTRPSPAGLLRLLALAILAAAAAGRLVAGLDASAPARPRVVVLGLDGVDPDVVMRLIAEGALPNLRRMRDDGAFGRLRSQRPMLSPILWTTIATGKPAAEHGIGHFVARNPKTGRQLPVTSQMRRVPALWNVVSGAGRRVAVVGWWATWPAEVVDGAIVSDHACYHFLFADGVEGARETVGITHPPELLARVARLIRRPADVGAAEVARFATVPAQDLARPFDFDEDLGHLRWAIAAARTHHDVALELWNDEHPDLLLAYVEGTDSVSHLFGHLVRTGGLAGELAAQQARYGGTVEAMYRYADEIVGDFLRAADANTTLLVLSDHGFELGELPRDPSRTRDMRRVSEHYHRDDGVLFLFGRGVKSGATVEGATLLDVAPTVLALLGLPPAQDMPGRVLVGGLSLSDPARTVASYGRPKSGDTTAGADDVAVDPAILARLESLGYLDVESPSGDRALAGVAFREKRWADAAAAYERLVADAPGDPRLHTSLAAALGELGRYDEALVHLERALALRPLNPEAHYNRAALYERQGKRDAAVAEYREALADGPGYAPASRALARLTGEAPVAGPTSNAERQAFAHLREAEDLARRGDYGAAMQRLDEAERTAPRYPLVFQYRANVAYLQRDYPAAQAALRRGLDLDPDNDLFRTNLERIERIAAAEREDAPRP
jgi:tetratricopeptide (TPR) repeat protein